jgi:hypothetical protein
MAASLPNPPALLKVLSHLFAHILAQHYEAPQMPEDFLELVASAVQHTRRCGRTNVIYNLTKALGTMRGDGSDSLLPARRMPTGLIEYAAAFFATSSIQKISCPPDYRMWLQSQYILFGSKFAKFFGGPMWSVESIMQSKETNPGTRAPTDALVNVPSLSERTIRRDIERSDVAIGPQIQVHVLNTASRNAQEVRWWIKADGVDVVKGLKESVKGEWSGDVDMNDGSLSKLFQEYQGRMEAAGKIGLGDGCVQQCMEADLIETLGSLDSDLIFIHSVLSRTNGVYEGNLQSGKHTEKAMLSLLWDLEELKHLNEEGRQLKVDISVALDVLSMPVRFQRERNLAGKLTQIRSKLSAFVKCLYRFRRTPASHIFVIMISSAQRRKKPYALPVQCVPYAGMKERDIRRLVNAVIKEMVNAGMKVAGFVSNGEFNYLRTKGYTRPLSVLQIRTDARNAYSRAKEDVMLSMLTPSVLPDGTVTAVNYNPAVPVSVLNEILQWTSDGALRNEVIDRLRCRTVPHGYKPHSWSPGKTETFREKLCSILAQFEYQYRIQMWHDKGVDFKTYLYVPEVHSETGEMFVEREDDAHVLKRIANHTRSGGPQQLNLQYFHEAYNDQSTGLTLAALTGTRKQSVVDAERFFGHNVACFMREKGYDYEYKFVETICNWRRSCDERGLSELQRCKFNYKLLDLILDELMPWHRSTYNFSLLEVNRPIKNVLGFSRETLAAVITNIEGRECLRRLNSDGAPEHPRASTSDDVECFFCMLRDTIGLNFTTKQVFFNFRKVALEFTKRLDPDLPFYYHTSSHSRYHEGPLADFNEASGNKRKLCRAPRREIRAAFAGRRATLPVQGSLSIRTQFHNQPLDLPPPPAASNTLTEHSYF